MWTCLYLSHIVVIIMIIIAVLGIFYGISQKKIKAYQVIVVFIFCVISMALVAGITSMNWISDLNAETEASFNNTKYDYWLADSSEFSRLVSDNLDFTKYVDTTTGNIIAVKNQAISTNDKADLTDGEEAKEAYENIVIKDEFNLSDDYLITLDSEKFIKLTDDLYYVSYNYEYTKDNEKETGKIYFITDANYEMKTFVMTNLINEDTEKDFTNNVLDLIGTMEL